MTPLVIAALGATAVTAIFLAWWLPIYLEERSVQRRMSSFVLDAPAEAGTAAPRRRTSVNRRPGTDPRRGVLAPYLEERIARARIDMTVAELLIAMAVFAFGTVAFALAIVGSANLVVAAIAAPVGAAIPMLWLRWREELLQRRFAEQLPDTVVLLASSVHAGLSLLQSFEHVARDAAEPTRSAFDLVVREMTLGMPQDVALERLADRYPSDDIELIVAAMNVHAQIGGNLPKMLDTIAETLRQRARVTGDIRVLTSQQMYASYVLAGLPVVVTVALLLISPDYIGVMLEQGLSRLLLVIAALMVLGGFVLMRRMARVDV